jgi:hypothetical protein
MGGTVGVTRQVHSHKCQESYCEGPSYFEQLSSPYLRRAGTCTVLVQYMSLLARPTLLVPHASQIAESRTADDIS